MTANASAFAQLHQVTGRLPDAAAFLVDPSLHYLWAAGSGLAAAGLREDDLIGKPVQSVMPPELVDAGVAAFRRGFAGQEFVHEHASHGRFYATRGVPILDEGGDVEAVLAISFDITDRKLAEEKCLGASQSKDDFIAAVAHELRTPLSAMLSLIEILRSQMDGNLASKSIQDILTRQVHHMARLIEDLFNATKGSHELLSLRREQMPLEDAIDDAVELARPYIDRKSHTLAVQWRGGSATLLADRTRLTQVFANLLVNAAKFTPEHGRITLFVETTEVLAQVQIADNGVGVPRERQAVIFHPFVRGATLADGLGLGLSIVRSIVELHGGTVTVSSEGDGQGSEFLVTLPIESHAARLPS